MTDPKPFANPPLDVGRGQDIVCREYLSGLALFQQITGMNARTLGANEKVAVQLGISASLATALQQDAYDTVVHGQTPPHARSSTWL